MRDFIAALSEWKAHGVLAVTVNFQGGSPEGYSRAQPWINGAFENDGSLRAAFANRMKRVLDAADANGMAVILGYFYFGQNERLRDEAAVLHATDEAARWLLKGGWRNVLVEVNNETNPNFYDHDVLHPDLRRAHIEPFAWVINQSFAKSGSQDPLLLARGSGEAPYIREVVEELSKRTALIPWVAEEPVGPEKLRQLFDVHQLNST